MKRTLIQSLFALMTLSILVSCKKKEDASSYYCTSCKRTPEALAANDASNKGIYKGIVTASTGTIKFDIQNNGSTITAVMVIDGTTVNLTSSVAVVNGQPYVAPFTGTLNGQPVTINFSVGLSGQNPTVTSSSIPGHPNAVFSIIKETSTNLIECFEGTYNTTRPETGIFNIVLSRTAGIWGGTSKAVTGATGGSSINGTVNANGTLFQNQGTQTIGTINGDVLTGTFVDSNNRTVNIVGNRTL